MKYTLFAISLLLAPLAPAAEPIEVRCAKQAEESDLVYPNIFSIVIDIKEVSSPSFNRAMNLLTNKTLQIIEWDIRDESEIRAFVTWPNDLATPEAKVSLQTLGKIDGVSTLCVSRSIQF